MSTEYTNDPFDAEAALQTAAEKAAVQEKQEQQDWYDVAATPAGRRVLRELVRFCRVGAPIWTPDSARLNYICGMQAAGLEIVDKVRRHAPEFLDQLLKDE